jgi:mono/diheme cytochrome c family protein
MGSLGFIAPACRGGYRSSRGWFMSNHTIGWFAAVACLVVPGPAWAGDEVLDPAAATKGQITYVRYCVSCHGEAGRGDGPLANDLRVRVPNLTALSSRTGGRYPFDHVTSVIRSGKIMRGHGSLDMPAWGDAFKRTEGTEEKTVDAVIRNLNHYLWSLQKPAKEPPPSRDKPAQP